MPAVADLKHKFSQELVDRVEKDLAGARCERGELIAERNKLLTKANGLLGRIHAQDDKIRLLAPLLQKEKPDAT